MSLKIKQNCGACLLGLMTFFMSTNPCNAARTMHNMIDIQAEIAPQENVEEPLMAWDLLSDELKKRNLARLLVLDDMWQNNRNQYDQNNRNQYELLNNTEKSEYRIRLGLGPILQMEVYNADTVNKLITNMRNWIGELRHADILGVALESLSLNHREARRTCQTDETRACIRDIQEIIGILGRHVEREPGPWRQGYVLPEYKRLLNPN